MEETRVNLSIDHRVGAKLAGVRESAGLSLIELACISEMSVHMLERYEAGEVPCLPTDLVILADVLNVPPSTFLLLLEDDQ